MFERIIILFYLSFPIFSAIDVGGEDYKMLDRVVGVIDNEPLTLKEVDEVALPLFYNRKDKESVSLSDIRNEVLETLIMERVFLKEAEKSGISVSERDIDEAIDDLARQNKVSKETLFNELKKDGIEEEKYREQIKNELIKLKYINFEIKPKINISEEEILSFYRSNPNLFTEKEKIDISGIFIPMREEDSKKFDISSILKDLNEGIKIDTIIKKNDLPPYSFINGEFYMEELIEPLQNAVSSLELHSFSEPVYTVNGVYIVKVNKRIEGKVKEFESVKDEIHRILYQKEINNLIEEWFKEKKKNHSIEILFKDSSAKVQ